MPINTRHRTQEAEIMDDFYLEGEELRLALDKIAQINKLLGGNRLTLEGVKTLLKQADKTQAITIADIGCGNGDMLRMLSDYGRKKGYSLKLVGIDANAYTIDYARKLSQEYPDIEYKCMDIFDNDFENVAYDVVLCTLTLHHFTDEDILKLIATFNKNANIGVVINDLHRSKLAYRLFSIASGLLNLNKMSREDGLTSILRGFRRGELQQFAKKLNLKNSLIRWKWAFRYQWIISKV